MARDQAQVTCPAGAYTQLTNGDVTIITFQALVEAVEIRFTTDTAAPAATLRGIVYRVTPESNQGEVNKAISDLTKLAGADRVWAKPLDNERNAAVYVDHA